MKSTIKNDHGDYNNMKNNNKCPKCLSGDMIEHPSFLSIPYTSRSKDAEKSKTAIEDQDADFVLESEYDLTIRSSETLSLSVFANLCFSKSFLIFVLV